MKQNFPCIDNVRAVSLLEEKEVSTMRDKIQKLPVAMEQPGLRIFSPGTWGGMVVEYFECDERIDFGPMLEGLPDDKCPCPHWGYMLKGAMHIQYADGTEEVINGGDVCHMPKGHTAWCEADSAMILFSPEAESNQVAEHVAKKMRS
jgi:hypothetical protein